MLGKATALVFALAACSSGYRPRAPGRVAVILDSGAPAYVRDGEVHKHGLMGGGLLWAVRGNPEAERAAHEYRSRISTGLLVGLGGLACSLVSVGFMVNSLTESDDDTAATAGLVAAGCSVLTFGGLIYTATAEPYRWDAINIYNDGVNLAPVPVPMPSGPPGMSAIPGTPGGRALK